MRVQYEKRRGLEYARQDPPTRTASADANATISSPPATTNAPPPAPGGSSTPLITASIVLIFAVLGIIFVWSLLRYLRVRHKRPLYVPTKYLKRKWENWNPTSLYHPAAQTYDAGDRFAPITAPTSNRNSRLSAPSDPPASNPPASATIDRNTSVRSVMTLPAYAPSPRENEQVLGREGERAGIDTVVEFPETVDEEEARRDADMEALYQVRLARRAEIAERQERARQRREARDRGDWELYEQLRAEARMRAESAASATAEPSSSTTTLDAPGRPATRDRRVSSVSYAEVGLARHDGTRVRANSSESERPLLDSAASMGGRSSHHSHGRSASLLSVSTNASDDPNAEVIRLGTLDASGTDLGDQPLHSVPLGEPPQYRDEEFAPAPPYESPVRTRAPQLPALSSLPAIEVTGTSPGNSRSTTPVPDAAERR